MVTLHKAGVPVAVSYSGGASSQWIVDAIINGQIARPLELAVFFAETGEEHAWTYDAVADTERRCAAAGIPFIRCGRGERLGDHILAAVREGRPRMDHPPFWIDKGGGKGRIGQRCTREFKSRVIRRAQARWLRSIGARKRLTTWIGFGADEKHRATKSLAKQDVTWAQLDFPAIRLGKTRAEQRHEVTAWNGTAPRFSMCTICPFKTPDRWAATGDADIARAVEVDEAIRDLDQFGITDGPAYLSDRLVPVASLTRKLGPDADLPVDGCDGGACFL